HCIEDRRMDGEYPFIHVDILPSDYQFSIVEWFIRIGETDLRNTPNSLHIDYPEANLNGNFVVFDES
ncbi:hypothetical protein PMAYCL1PPCAC_24872, partial [Pristionchus mayeri]